MKVPAIVLVAAAAAQAAAADKSDLSVQETRKLMYDYAACVVAKRPAQASAAILGDVDNATIIKRFPALIDSGCLGREVIGRSKMRFTGDLYRYALADALVARDYAKAPAPALAAVAPLTHRSAGDPPAALGATATKTQRARYDRALASYNERATFRFLATYGECVVRADAPGAKALLDVRPDSPGDAERFRALGNALQRCMPEGQTVAMGKVALRGSIATNYYRLAHAAAGR